MVNHSSLVWRLVGQLSFKQKLVDLFRILLKATLIYLGANIHAKHPTLDLSS